MRKLTHEEFMEKFYKQNKHAHDIEILGTYEGAFIKIKCKCKVCGHEWTTKANNLLQGQGCPQCKKNVQTKTQEEFTAELKQINPNIVILGEYISAKTKVKCRCTVCGHEWKVTPNNLLRERGCPKCAGKAKPTQEEFINKLYRINPDIEVLGTYINRNTKVECKCKIYEHEWKATPGNLLSGRGCPKCNISRGEKRITQYLDNLGINYIYDKRYFKDLYSTSGTLLRPDFIIPSLKIWIEFDGRQHFEPVDFTSKWNEQQLQEQFKIVQQNDQIKNQYAKDNNWTLIRIPFTEYDNIEQILAEYIEQEQVI